MSESGVSTFAQSAAHKVRYAVAPLALLASSSLVWHASDAAFRAETSNGANQWAAGTVVLTDDDSAAAMLDVKNLVPGASGSRCIAVRYDGSVAASVEVYGTVTGSLGDYLNLTVEQGSGGGSAGCAGFTPESTIYDGTLARFPALHPDHANGAGSFSPSGPGQVKTYRFTYSLVDANAAQGLTASAAFKWEARSV